MFELKVDKGYGALELNQPDGKTYAQFLHDKGVGGLLKVNGDKEAQRLEVSGTGMVTAHKLGEVVAKFPATDGK